MSSIRQQLINKIKKDVDLCGLEDKLTTELTVHRPALSWQQKTAGRMTWYWYINGQIVGSAENMKELLKSPKIGVFSLTSGDYEISSY